MPDPTDPRRPDGAPPAAAPRSMPAPRAAGASPPGLPDVAPGSRLEIAGLLVKLAGDLLSGPFHLLAFLLFRGRHRRRFREALEESAR